MQIQDRHDLLRGLILIRVDELGRAPGGIDHARVLQFFLAGGRPQIAEDLKVLVKEGLVDAHRLRE